MPKIALIGAGSVVFANTLTVDILSIPELRDSSLSLMDIDEDRLELSGRVGQAFIDKHKLPAKVEWTTDRRRALDGADYVIVMVQIGGLSAVEMDINIPMAHGLDQDIGDTLGPGGVFRGVRTIPVLLDMCKEMEELCPKALLINYSNPMAINCWGLGGGQDKIKFVGLCHSVQGTAGQLAHYSKIPFEETSYWVGGINHMSWFLKFEWKGEDAYPLLRKAMDDPEVCKHDKVRFEIMRHFGYFVTESSYHMSEYVPYFRKRPDLIEEFLMPRYNYLRMCREDWKPHYEHKKKQVSGEEPLPELSVSGEYCSRIIHAIETNQPYRLNGNVPNTGLITNLPDGCIVEVPILVDAAGLHPCFIGDLPSQCAALNRTNINVQELAAQAALEGDPDKLRMAIALDPHTAATMDLRSIRKMVDEMIAAERKLRPEFLRGQG
ncbi:MAG: alpha-glucosidase/alpha-galactosidase [Armatimonadota bacterium]|nr:alpha-glucosidase/alpha-galactosidase [Armatimonadota bacterium]